MKFTIYDLRFTLALAALLTTHHSLLADLQVSGTPGFTFSDTAAGRPTVANLNRALQFTYSIAGTIGGTNAGLGAESVSPYMLQGALAGTNLTWDGYSHSAGLVIADGGVNVAQVNTNICGAGLGGGGGTNLYVQLDTNYFVVRTNAAYTNLPVITFLTNWPANVTIKTNPASTNNFTATTNDWVLIGDGDHSNDLARVKISNFQIRFTSSNFVLRASAGVVANSPHGLNGTPASVRWVLTCRTNDVNGYTVGDEIEAGNIAASAGNTAPAMLGGANSSNVFFIWYGGEQPSLWELPNKTNGAQSYLTLTNWAAKCYAQP